jgi:hypothetical protein
MCADFIRGAGKSVLLRSVIAAVLDCVVKDFNGLLVGKSAAYNVFAVIFC